MNPVLQTILDSGRVQAADGSSFPVHSEIPRQSGALLHQLVLQEKPKTTLEVGLAYGISALFICDALRTCGGVRHIVIDPLQLGAPNGKVYRFDDADWQKLAWAPQSGWRAIGLHNLERAGFKDLIEFHSATSHAALPDLVKRGESIDFAFIDGWHTFDYVLVDFFYVDMLLRVGGVVAFDDSNYPAIRKVLRYVMTNRRYSLVSPAAAPAKAPGWRRRVVNALGRTRLGSALAPETLAPDHALHLPKGRFIALRKEADDLLGDGTSGSRRWNFHKPF